MWLQQLQEIDGQFDHVDNKRVILRQKPFFAADLDDFYAFLHARSGGVKGEFWKEFVAFHKAFVTPSLRSMQGAIFRVLADFPHMLLAYATLKAACTCPKM